MRQRVARLLRTNIIQIVAVSSPLDLGLMWAQVNLRVDGRPPGGRGRGGRRAPAGRLREHLRRQLRHHRRRRGPRPRRALRRPRQPHPRRSPVSSRPISCSTSRSSRTTTSGRPRRAPRAGDGRPPAAEARHEYEELPFGGIATFFKAPPRGGSRRPPTATSPSLGIPYGRGHHQPLRRAHGPAGAARGLNAVGLPAWHRALYDGEAGVAAAGRCALGGLRRRGHRAACAPPERHHRRRRPSAAPRSGGPLPRHARRRPLDPLSRCSRR